MEKTSSTFNSEKYHSGFAERFRELVDGSDDIRRIAAFLGISTQAVNQFKLGQAFPKVENLLKLAEYFDCSLDYLIGMSDVKKPLATVKGACEYTGLSEEAVSVLHEYKEHQITAQAKALDLLLSSREGKVALGSIFLYLTRNYDAFSMPQGVPVDASESSDISKSVVLWERGNPKEELLVENLSELFMLNIQRELGKLRDKMKEGEGK